MTIVFYLIIDIYMFVNSCILYDREWKINYLLFLHK